MSFNHATVAIDDLQETEMESMTEINVIEPHLFLLQKKSSEVGFVGANSVKTITISGILSVSF
ncbi:MAG: hypothetical protein WC222_04395 [Parachlamydiales bacterium]